MKLAFGTTPIERAPKGYTRLRLLSEKGVKRLVREGDTEWLELGVGPELNRRKFVIFARSIVRIAREQKIKKLAIDFSSTPEIFKNVQDISPEELTVITATAFEMANYEATTYKTKPKDGWSAVEEILLLSPAGASIKAALKRGVLIGEAVNACRELSNMPGGNMTPKVLADAAKKAAKGTKATVKVLGRKDMQKLGMGAVLGIAQGSTEEPQFIIVEYKGGKAGEKPVVLVGKGVTFDTGGLQIKPGDHMYEMHMDMSGGAAVIHAAILAAKLGVQKNVVALVPAVENSPSGHAIRPGDILKSLSGKTIEILHTDAEGRVILADAITYAKRYNPAVVIDVATLTGAVLTALGVQASGFMTNDEAQIPAIQRMGERSGDYLWPFPAWEEYEDMTKGHFGDVPNISTAGNSRYGGVIAGGMFIKRFADELNCLWIHIDMASRMTSAPGEQLAKGAAGAPVRFLLEFIERYAHNSKN